MKIANNLPALGAYASLNKTNTSLQKSIKRLSTGLRINQASDDAAGFAISEKMRSQISGLDTARRNTQDGVSLLQTAEGALGETNSMLQRMRELAVQAANDSLTSNDRQYLQLEIDKLQEQIDRIADTTQFNKKRLLDGSSGALWSSDDLKLKAKINGGLTYVDNFGQKVSAEGNYKIEINASGGQAQVQKSSPVFIKHENVTMNRWINRQTGVNNISVNNLPAGYYNLEGEPPTEARAFVTGSYGIEVDTLDESLTASVRNSYLLNNASILFEVTGVDSDSGFITLKASANILKTDGTNDVAIQENIFLKEGAFVDLSSLLKLGTEGTDSSSADGAFELQLQDSAAQNFQTGDKFVYNLNVAENVEGADRVIKITNEQTTSWPGHWEEPKEIQRTNSFRPVDPVPVSARVIFLIDRSGSMDPYIGTVADNLKQFIYNIKNPSISNATINVSAAVAGYSTLTWSGPPTLDPYSFGSANWSDNEDDIQSTIQSITLSGGLQDHYAAIIDAIDYYGITSSDPEKTFVVLVTDTDQEFGSSSYTAADAVTKLKDANVQCSIIRPSKASKDLDSIASSTSGSIFNDDVDDKWKGTQPIIYKEDWGTQLSDQLGPKIGNDTINSRLQGTPFYEFEELQDIFPSSSSDERTITITQDGVSTDINIGPNDTLKTLSEKISAVTGSETTADFHDDEDSNERCVSLNTNLPDGSSVKFSGDQELLNKLGFRSNLEQKISLDSNAIKNKNVHFKHFNINHDTGEVFDSDITITTDAEKPLEEWGAYSKFQAAYVTEIPKQDVRLRDLNIFWNSQGVFLLDQPQTLTISQGNGQKTSVTLYETDTVEDVRAKLNDAIANGLGQANIAQADKFVSFVQEGQEQNNGLETVPGTFVIRSAIPGKAGEISFSGDEDLLNALGFNTIQESSETTFTASVREAHTGKVIASNIKATGNVLNNILPNVDIEFDPMAGLSAEWDENTKRFIINEKEVYTAYLHLKDNGITFQTGANTGEDFMIQLGDTSCNALGIENVNLTTRKTAARSISILDKAINKISSQRSKIGAYQNALEHTMENLTTTSLNLTSAESRIRDADMSKEMMEFVKLQILNQSGVSMLSQANQLPQSILTLLGR